MKHNTSKTVYGWGDERVTKSHKSNSIIAQHKRKDRQDAKINALLHVICNIVCTNINLVDKQDGHK